MLGVCYGHQLMAAAFGGHVDFHPEGRESGTLAVRLTETGRADALLGTLPERFYAHLTHAQSVLEAPSEDRKSTRLNSSHVAISYAVFCLKKKNVPRRAIER